MAETGNIGLGILVGFILMAVIGWIPVVGALIAGIAAGAIAKGPARGLTAGFVSGIIGLVILWILFTFVGASVGGAMGAFIGGILGIGISGVLAIVGFGGIAFVTLGGLIGGSVKPRKIIPMKIPESKKYEKEEDEDYNEEAMRILKQRYATGEITKKEFGKIKKDLKK
jgi:hypothetical protein